MNDNDNILEIWYPVIHEDIIENMYEISNLGRIKNIKTGKFLEGNNPDNEKGYRRVCLQTYNGGKKFAIHRLVLATFWHGDQKDKEVNHSDCNKLDNSLYNLEYNTRKENAAHAAVNHLYKTCEDHHKALFTNKQVNEICKMLSEGYSMCKIKKELNLTDIKHIDAYISRIKNHETWNDISINYYWKNEDVIYKTYKSKDIEEFCKLLFLYKYKVKDIVLYFPEYDPKKLKDVLKKIKHRKLYKSFSDKYFNQNEGSTTSENDDYYNIYIR